MSRLREDNREDSSDSPLAEGSVRPPTPLAVTPRHRRRRRCADLRREEGRPLISLWSDRKVLMIHLKKCVQGSVWRVVC